jgi:hypothetical protein
MVKYFLGSIIVLGIALLIVNFSIKKTGLSGDEMMDVPGGEYENIIIKKAATEEDGYVLLLEEMQLFENRHKTGITSIYFPTKKNAKLVMKHRHAIMPFMAKTIRGMTIKEALKPETQYAMIKSLKDGYAKKYGITNMTKVLIEDYSCQFAD